MVKRFIVSLLFLVLSLPVAVSAGNLSHTTVTTTLEAATEPEDSKMAAENSEMDSEDSSAALGSSVSASKGQISTDDFDIKVECGLNGNFKLGASLPVVVHITSKKKDFEGTVRIVIPGDMDYGTGSVAFEKSVMLSEGQQKAVAMSVSNSTGSNNIYLQIDNAKGKNMINQRITMVNQSNISALAGVLTDDYTALNYLDKKVVMKSGSDSYDIQLVELDEESVPEQASGLEALSYLIINSYDTSKLSTDQIAAIEGWVRQGGILVLGTGPDYQRTLSAVPKELADVTVSGMAEGMLCTKDDEEKVDVVDFDESAGIVKLSVEDGVKIDNVLSQKNLIWNHKFGNGSVVVTAFNLGMQPVSGWTGKDEMAELLLNEITDAAGFERIGKLNNGDSYWYNQNVLRMLRDDETVNIAMIMVILVLFAAFLPISYLILKKMDRRGLLWSLIPAGAVFFTVLIFLATSNVRIRYPKESSITTLQQEGKEKNIKQNVRMSILVPAVKRVDLKLAESISNLRSNSSYDYYNYGNSQVDLDYKSVIKEDAQGYTIGIKNQETFQSSYFTMENTDAQPTGDGISSELVRSFSGISGKITNNTGRDLKGVMVLSDYGSVSIGELKDGETKEIKEADNTFGMNFSDGMYGDLLYGMNIPGLDKESKEYQKIMWVYDEICSSTIQQMALYDSGQSVFILGYLGELESDYIVDDKVEENNYAAYVAHDTLSFKDYEDAKVVSLFGHATKNNDWDQYDGQLYATEVQEEFDLKDELGSVYALIRTSQSRMYYSYNNTTIYALNLETKVYDELFTDGDVMEFKDGCPYLDDAGVIKMKFTCKQASTDAVPSILVVGGED